MTDQPVREIFVALANPVEGRDDEFNDWYENVHIPEVLQLPGFVSAQRHRVSGDEAHAADFRYLTVYEIEGSASQARDRLFGAGFEMSEALDLERVVFAPYAPLGQLLRGSGGAQ